MRLSIFAFLFSAFANAASAHSVFAQSVSTASSADASQSGVVRGSVTAKLTGAVLARSVVTIAALDLQQFSNDQGRFYLVKVKPGKYRLNVRQLGYLPVNVDIFVDETGSADVTVQMDRIATKLSTFTVTDQQLCETPGRPTQADGEQLVEVFEQLEQSAIRLALLARQFPYKMIIERRMLLRRVDGRDVPERNDTFSRDGQKTAQYQPGGVVTRSRGTASAYSLQIPTLLDFADAKFIANHCFTLRGLETLPVEAGGDGVAFIRVDFTAASKLKNPDVDGSVFLDSADYSLRRAEVRLSKLPENLQEIASVRVTSTFQDYVPGMPIIGLVQAITEMKEVKGKPYRFVSRNEQQIVANLVFSKQRPDSVRPPQ